MHFLATLDKYKVRIINGTYVYMKIEIDGKILHARVFKPLPHKVRDYGHFRSEKKYCWKSKFLKRKFSVFCLIWSTWSWMWPMRLNLRRGTSNLLENLKNKKRLSSLDSLTSAEHILTTKQAGIHHHVFKVKAINFRIVTFDHMITMSVGCPRGIISSFHNLNDWLYSQSLGKTIELL